MAWDSVCRPTCFRGLGIKDLPLQAIALRAHWEWLRRTDPSRPWQGIPMAEDKMAKLIFNSLIKINLGDGERVMFWKDGWIHGFTVGEIAPSILELVSTRARNCRTVKQALIENAWSTDVQGYISFTAHMQVANLCLTISTVPRNDQQPDQFIWPADKSGNYTAGSVYHRLCMGLLRSPTAECIWRSWAPLCCKIFAWLTVQYRLWTSDRRARHGL